MYIQDLFIKYYDYRPFQSTLPNKVLGNFSKIGAVLASYILPFWFKLFPGKNDKTKKYDGLVVSLTSFPARINTVWLVIECLLRQTVLPEQIVLYLSKEQFDTIDKLPSQLLSLVKRHVLVIKMVDQDIRSHKKYWYAIKDYPNKILVTVDDDIIYESNAIEQLLQFYKEHPKCIPARFVTKMCFDEVTKHILPYSKWKGRVDKGKIGSELFFGSGGGTLFPPNSLSGANVTFDTIRNICPLADDIWLNAWVRKNGYIVGRASRYSSVPEWNIRQNSKLCNINNGKCLNDVQLFKTVDYFLTKFKINPFLLKKE